MSRSGIWSTLETAGRHFLEYYFHEFHPDDKGTVCFIFTQKCTTVQSACCAWQVGDANEIAPTWDHFRKMLMDELDRPVAPQHFKDGWLAYLAEQRGEVAAAPPSIPEAVVEELDG